MIDTINDNSKPTNQVEQSKLNESGPGDGRQAAINAL